MKQEMDGVREYAEDFPVELMMDADVNRLVIYARNEGGHNCTCVDLLDLLAWIQKHRADLLTGEWPEHWENSNGA